MSPVKRNLLAADEDPLEFFNVIVLVAPTFTIRIGLPLMPLANPVMFLSDAPPFTSIVYAPGLSVSTYSIPAGDQSF